MNIKNIIVHHTGGTDANPMQDSSNYSIAQCNADHKVRFNNFKSKLGWYVGYHYFIDKYGKVTQTRKDDEEGTHCVGYNNHPGDNPEKASIGICLAGNFDATLPTEAQKTALKKLLTDKMAQYSISPLKIVPHRTYAKKTCFGTRLASNWAASLLDPVIITPPTESQWTKVKDMIIAKDFKHNFIQGLKYQDNGDEVKNLQIALCLSGDLDIYKNELGGYGTRTAAAVYKFQTRLRVASAQELESLQGKTVGPATRAALNKLFNK